MHANQREQILRNCSDKWRGQYQPDGQTIRVWQKLGPAHVVALLEQAAIPARTEARVLLRRMAMGPWRIGATVHRGGHGEAARGVDPRPHITLSVAGRSHHLRCLERGGLHVVQITA